MLSTFQMLTDSKKKNQIPTFAFCLDMVTDSNTSVDQPEAPNKSLSSRQQ